jgi:hypothetical protein
MTPSLPGARLHRLLMRWAPATVLRDVVEPSIADLQYEAERAPTISERRQIILQGHFAVFRALLLSIEPGTVVRATLALSALCARGVTAVSLGSGIATLALLVARRPHGQQLSIAMVPFYLALFAALFGLTLLPFLLLARAFIARPALLAIAGLMCSPSPWIAAAYIDHRTLSACLDTLRRTPLSFAASSLPFVIGAIVVGWRLPPSGRPCDSSLLR